MLILAEGTVSQTIEGDARTAAQAWLGPMVDDGFVVDAYRQRSRGSGVDVAVQPGSALGSATSQRPAGGSRVCRQLRDDGRDQASIPLSVLEVPARWPR